MSKFNASQPLSARVASASSPVSTLASQPAGVTTHEGGPGLVRDARSDLFLLAVVNFVGEDTFYESAGTRDERFRNLVREVAVQDGEWMERFIPWLRNGANMRSASIVAAVEAADAQRKAFPGKPTQARQFLDGAIARADEPGEALAYAKSRGIKVSGGIQRGIADAVQRLYTERNLLKYDGQSKNFRFGDVIELVHPKPRQAVVAGEELAAQVAWQGDLFKYAIDRRHKRENLVTPASLKMLQAREQLESVPVAERRAFLRQGTGEGTIFHASGMTWEALSGWLQGPMDQEAWEAMIPQMGYMALLRNLRNFDEQGVSDAVAKQVAAKLSDPEEVAKSRQFPYRFFTAYKAAPSLRWGAALDEALNYATKNIPELPGRTLVLCDTSASMNGMGFSAKSVVTPATAAAIFATAIAKRGNAVDFVGFADGVRPFRHDVPAGASLLKTVDSFIRRIGEDGHGTAIGETLQRTYKGHDRVVIVSDMQTGVNDSNTGYYGRGVSQLVPASVPMYGFNLGGYSTTVVDSAKGNRHEFGGLNDSTFKMISLLEAGKDAGWPF